jgi:hypothetical protein
MKRLSLAFVALVAAACSTPSGIDGDGGPQTPFGSGSTPAARKTELEANRRKFETAIGSRYTIEFQLGCFCTEEARAKVRLTVRDRAIVSVVRVSDGAAVPQESWAHTYKTVGQVFDAIEEGIEKRYPVVNVTYDPTFGFPREVYLDEAAQLADEERSYSFGNVERLR